MITKGNACFAAAKMNTRPNVPADRIYGIATGQVEVVTDGYIPFGTCNIYFVIYLQVFPESYSFVAEIPFVKSSVVFHP